MAKTPQEIEEERMKALKKEEEEKKINSMKMNGPKLRPEPEDFLQVNSELNEPRDKFKDKFKKFIDSAKKEITNIQDICQFDNKKGVIKFSGPKKEMALARYMKDNPKANISANCTNEKSAKEMMGNMVKAVKDSKVALAMGGPKVAAILLALKLIEILVGPKENKKKKKGSDFMLEENAPKRKSESNMSSELKKLKSPFSTRGRPEPK